MAVTQRWPLPANTAPTGKRCLQVTIPDDDDYQTLLLAAVNALSYWMVWQRDDLNSGSLVADIFKQVMKSWTDCAGNPVPSGTLIEVNPMEGLFQIICDTDGKCKAQIRCNICDPWTTLATLNDLITNPPGTGNQPAPGGGQASYCGKLQANGGMVVPIPMNTGDVITIQSATGSWSDGSLAYHCIDGNDYFIECLGVGAAPAGGSDFVPTAPHMSAIIRFSTGDFALYPGASFTVGMGVSNEQPLLLANKAALNTGLGEIDVCIQVTNNAAATFTHVSNFITSPDGWLMETNFPGETEAVYVPGQGWQSAFPPSQPTNAYLYLGRTLLHSATINSVQIGYIVTGGGGLTQNEFYANATLYGTVPSAIGTYNQLITNTVGSVTSLHVRFESSAPASSIQVISITVKGQGHDPF